MHFTVRTKPAKMLGMRRTLRLPLLHFNLNGRKMQPGVLEVFYRELKKRSALTKQAEAAIVRMKERVEDQKAQCKGFSKNLKEKKVEDVDGDVASGVPGPDNFAKLGKNKKLLGSRPI